MSGSVLFAVRPAFRALAATIVPGAARLDDPGWRALEGIVEGALGARPPALRRQLRIFIRLLEWLPLLRYGRRFTRLDPTRRSRFLAAVEDAPLLLVRRGFWGFRTLVMMGYYGRPQATAGIGYRAHLRGWHGRGLGPAAGGAGGTEAPPRAESGSSSSHGNFDPGSPGEDVGRAYGSAGDRAWDPDDATDPARGAGFGVEGAE